MPWVERPSTELRFHPGPPSCNAAPYLSARDALPQMPGKSPSPRWAVTQAPRPAVWGWRPSPPTKIGLLSGPARKPLPGKMLGVGRVEHRPRKYGEELAGWGRLLPGAPEPASWGEARETRSTDWACPGRPRQGVGAGPGSTAPGAWHTQARPQSSQSLLKPVPADPSSSFPTILLHKHAPTGPGLTGKVPDGTEVLGEAHG